MSVTRLPILLIWGSSEPLAALRLRAEMRGCFIATLLLPLVACGLHARRVAPGAPSTRVMRSLRTGSSPRCSVLSGLKLEEATALAVGDRVRVQGETLFQHVPGHKQGFDADGLEGEVVRVYGEGNLSPNRPVKVIFTEPKKWFGHFEDYELVKIV